MTTENKKTNAAPIRIYLTNLGKYNEGELVGEWVDFPISSDDLDAVLERIGINEEYEETFITDYETEFDGLKIGEYSQLDELNEIAEQLDALDDYERDAVDAYLREGFPIDEAIDNKDEVIFFTGCYSMADVAEQYAEETGLLDSIPEDLRYYFDFEKFGRDMEIEGHFVETSTGFIELLA